MRASTRREFVAGPAGRIECAVDEPEGGAARRRADRASASAVRRHAGQQGRADARARLLRARLRGLAAQLPRRRRRPRACTTRAAARSKTCSRCSTCASGREQVRARRLFVRRFAARRKLAETVDARAAGAGRRRRSSAFMAPPVPPDTLVIHGENDETVPLAAVLDWARPQELPVVVVPGADHFFHRRLHILRAHRRSGTGR